MSGGTLFGVGVGPGDPELLTLKAVRLLERCPVVAAPRVGGRSASLDVARQAADLSSSRILPLDFSMSADAGAQERDDRAAADLLEGELASGRDVAMAVVGDPSLYSTFSRVGALVRDDGYTVAAVPGVPSFCAAAAAAGEDLAPEADSPFVAVPAGSPALAEALALPGAKAVMKAGRRLPELRRALSEAGRDGGAVVVSDAGLSGERVVPLSEAGDTAPYFTTVVVGA